MDRVGDYDLQALIGIGASGSVWQASRRGPLAHPVAVKRVHTATGPPVAGRLRAEAHTLGGLDHPHIVRVLDVVEDGPDVAIVMPLARGGSLRDLLGERSLTVGEVVAVLAPVADALASAHRVGILHGDVRAANVLLTADGEPLLADFGIARSAVPGGGAGGGADGSGGAAEDAAAFARLVRHALGPSAATPAGRSLVDAVDGATGAELGRALRAAVPAAEVALPGPALGRRGPGRVTREFGPRPPPPTSSGRARARARRWPVALAVAGAFAGAVAVGLGRTRTVEPTVEGPVATASARACPPVEVGPVPAGAVRVAADLRGDGCAVSLVWRAGVIEVGAAGDPGGVRRFDFAPFGSAAPLRQEGTLLVGDWDCDGADGVALVDPGRTVVRYFDRLPPSGALRPDGEEALHGTGAPHVVRTGGCDTVVPGRPSP